MLAWGRHTASEHIHSQWCESAVKSHQLLACVHRTTTVTAPVGQCGLDTGRDMHTGVPEPVVVSVVRHMRVHDCCRTFNEHVEERGSYVKLKVLVVALVPCSGTSDSRWHGGLACPADMHMAAAHGRVRPAPARCMATATTAAAHGRVRPTPALHVSNTKTASTVGTPCFPLDYSLCWNTYFFRQHRTHIGCNIAGHADRDAGPATARIRTRLNGHDGPLGV